MECNGRNDAQPTDASICLSADPEARAVAYRLLARAFRREPDVVFLADLRSDLCRQVMERVGGLKENFLSASGVGAFSTPAEDSRRVETLSREFSRLFIGPPPLVPLYESLHRPGPGNGEYWGEAAVSMKHFVEALGLNYREDRNDMPDHVSVELELMARLLDTEVQANAAENTDAATRARHAQALFLCRHLCGWLPRFFDKLKAETREPFYATIAEWGGKFFRLED